jgi:hypothetical protein
MSDLITIFIDGGEYVNRAAYIEQRDEASELRERIEQLEAALREIRDVALCSEGVDFYAMLADKALEK